MNDDSLACLLFVLGSTLCALPCKRVGKVTPVEEAAREDWLDLADIGIEDSSSRRPSRLLWLSGFPAAAPLPISGACDLLTVARADLLPLPPFHRRLTPFVALLRAERTAALLLEPARLTRPASVHRLASS